MIFSMNFYKNKIISSGFGVDRGLYKHSGIDIVGTKNDYVTNVIDGVVSEIIYDQNYFGTQCIVYSNLQFAGGIDEIIFHSYCHLDDALARSSDFVRVGTYLGKMGNTGGCYTKYDSAGNLSNSYRLVTREEQEDKNCNFGVHLHLWFYQKCAPGKSTKLLKELTKLKIISQYTLGDTHFYQWNKLIFAPRVISSYFKYLNKKER